MKTLAIATLILSLTSFAGEVKPHAANKEAYKKAHDACLVENKDLKGKALKECIMKKEKEKETTTATAK